MVITSSTGTLGMSHFFTKPTRQFWLVSSDK